MKNGNNRSKTLKNSSHSLNKQSIKAIGNFELIDTSEGIVAKKYYQFSNDNSLNRNHNNVNVNHSPEQNKMLSAKEYLNNRTKLAMANIRSNVSYELPYIRQCKVSSNQALPHVKNSVINNKPQKQSINAETFRKKSGLKQNKYLVKGEAKSRSTFSLQGTGATEKKDNISKYLLGNIDREKISIIAKPRKRVMLGGEQNKDMNSSFDKKETDGLGIGLQSKKVLSSALSQKGVKEDSYSRENQDSYVCLDNIFELEEFGLYAVMDGHGSNGHLVSKYLKKKAEEYFSDVNTYLKASKKEQISVPSSMYEEKIFERLHSHEFALIKKFYKIANKDLDSQKFDVHFSGSTCVMIFKTGRKLIVANTGDSRAILVKENKGKKIPKQCIDPCARYEVEALSKDHKPDLKEEKERIEKSGGLISQFIEEDGLQGGPYRVWVKGEKYPGIAMSRSIGDHIAKEVGVICEPEINVFVINMFCKYIVVASDGIWDFLSNEEVMDIVNPYFLSGDPEGATEELVKIATERWKKEEEVIDDITVVVSFIGHPHVKKGTV